MKTNTMLEKKENISPARLFVLLILFAMYIVPFVLVLINSFKTKTDIVMEPLNLLGTHGFSFNNYFEALERMDFFHVLWNTFYITIFSVILIVLFSALAAYLIARSKWLACKITYYLMIGSMAVPFQVIMIPLVSIYGITLGLLNSPWTLIAMHTGFGVSMGTFLFSGAIRTTVPVELEEAATIDGCGKFGIFFRIVLPLLKPMIATIVIIDSLAIWNDYLLPSLVLGKANLFTIPIAVRTFIGTFSSDYGLMMAGLVMSVAPILLLYILLQKHIIAGVVSGAVKG